MLSADRYLYGNSSVGYYSAAKRSSLSLLGDRRLTNKDSFDRSTRRRGWNGVRRDRACGASKLSRVERARSNCSNLPLLRDLLSVHDEDLECGESSPSRRSGTGRTAGSCRRIHLGLGG